MPADSTIGLGTLALRVAVYEARSCSVSEIVEGGEADRRVIRASIAAMGWVSSGSLRRWVLYADTILGLL